MRVQRVRARVHPLTKGRTGILETAASQEGGKKKSTHLRKGRGQMQKLPAIASVAYLDGIEKAGFVANHIPDFEHDTNPRLQALTGWSVGAVEGLVPIKEFFEHLADKKFPASNWLRTCLQIHF